MSDRRPRGWLNSDINGLMKSVVSGEVQVDPDAPLTPSAIANLLVEVEGLDKEDRPSPGAVSAVLARWERVGYAVIEKSPTRFVDFTEAAKEFGYNELEKEFFKRGGKHNQPLTDEQMEAQLERRNRKKQRRRGEAITEAEKKIAQAEFAAEIEKFESRGSGGVGSILDIL